MQLNLSLIQVINRLQKSVLNVLTQSVVATIFNLKPSATKYELATVCRNKAFSYKTKQRSLHAQESKKGASSHFRNKDLQYLHVDKKHII